MAIPSNSEDSRILRKLYPLITFPSEAFKDLCANTTIEHVQDAALFKKGDTNTDLVYLLQGSVTLQADGLIVEVITSESESAKFALAHQIPRKVDAIANGLVRIVRLDAQAVNNPPPAVYLEDQSYTVVDEASTDSDDWMTVVLRLPLFQNLPANNLQKILMSLKKVDYSAGEEIITHGKDVDYFYLIQKGQCVLVRHSDDIKNELTLGAGDSFGEEYLLADFPATETVTAKTDVSLILLTKDHFLSQIKAPTLSYISRKEMPGAIDAGAVLLDVRLPQRYENQNLDGSANIPLMTLRLRFSEIPKDKQIVVVCAQGKLSEAAAFLLMNRNFNAVALQDGMGLDETDDAQESNDGNDNLEENAAVNVTQSATEKIQSPEIIPEKPQESEPLNQENLLLRIRELEELNTKLMAEKAEIENQYQVLTQQMARLKDILNRLTKRQ